MGKLVSSFLAFTFLFATCVAAASGVGKATICSTAVEVHSVTPLLFAAEKDGNVTFIFGTRHVGFSLENFPHYVGNLFSSSDSLVTENNASMLEGFVCTVKTLASMCRLSGPPLSETLSPAAYEKLVSRFKEKLGLGDGLLKRLTPFGASTIMDLDLKSKKSGVYLEKEMEKKARKLGMKISGLETSEIVGPLISAFTPQILEAELLTELPLSAPGAFERGDFEAYNQVVRNQEQVIPSIANISLTQRNISWTKQIVERHSLGGRMFIAVGAMHLAGEQGLVALLSAEGFRVTRVNEANHGDYLPKPAL